MLNDILKKRLFDRSQKLLTRQRITTQNKCYNKIYIFDDGYYKAIELNILISKLDSIIKDDNTLLFNMK